MRKKIIALLATISLLGSLFIYVGEKPAIAHEDNDLLTLVTVLKGENININEWSLHAREKYDATQLEDVKEHVQKLQAQFPQWTWEISSYVDKWQATASIESNQGIQENIQILSTLKLKNPQTYIIYEAQGLNFTNKTEQFIKEELTGKISDIFRGNATIFSCLIGEFNDKMNTSLPFTVNRLLDSFQATEIEKINEPDFIATSAYSPLFNEGIVSNQDDMNLQLGVRTNGLGAKTTIVVGTPIITIEY